MSMPLDPVTMKKLALVKQLYQQAYLQSVARSSPVSRIIAVVTFDLATETALKVVFSKLNPASNPDNTFQALIRTVEDLLPSIGVASFPDKAQIQHVHSIRNDAQHKAKYPTEIEVNDCRTYTKDFLEHITIQVWDKKFDEISLTDLIQHAKIKERLVEAETYFVADKYIEAITYAKAAFNKCINLVIKKVIGELPQFQGTLSTPIDNYATLEKMKTMLMLQTLGLNFAEYAKYQQASGAILVSEAMDGTLTCRLKKSDFTVEEAKFTVSYVVDAILQIESYVGDIEKPFGIEYR